MKTWPSSTEDCVKLRKGSAGSPTARAERAVAPTTRREAKLWSHPPTLQSVLDAHASPLKKHVPARRKPDALPFIAGASGAVTKTIRSCRSRRKKPSTESGWEKGSPTRLNSSSSRVTFCPSVSPPRLSLQFPPTDTEQKAS